MQEAPVTRGERRLEVATYVVTGGCGFIGSHLVESLLSDGHEVRILDDLSTGKRENVPPDCEVVVGDVSHSKDVNEILRGADGCFHLAAIASVARSNEDWAGTHRVNLTGTINVLEGARHAREASPIPVVYASSAAIYGDNPNVPLTEDSQARPLTAYGADKYGSEIHARVACVVHKVPTFGLRFFNVYGPRQDPHSPYSGVISIFTERVRSGQAISIHGDGSQQRDFIFVKDVVRFLRKAMDEASLDAEVLNVCTGRTTTITELANTIMDLESSVPINHTAPRCGDIKVSLGNPDRARQRLGIEANILLKDGLRQTL